jgi:CRISPR-associated protein Csx17
MTVHVLSGLKSDTLKGYLGSLGVHRVIASQADSAARSWFVDGVMHLDTGIQDLPEWLVHCYAPSPILSPWNKSSGFDGKDDNPSRVLQTLETASQGLGTRLDVLLASRSRAAAIAALGRSANWDKKRLVAELRNVCPDELLQWIDAATVLTGDSLAFPPLLGTGGNDGRLDFSTNFHQRLLDVLPTSERTASRSLGLARDALGGGATQRLVKAAVGQFDAAGAGLPNSSALGAADSIVNPWHFILLIEGSLLFAAAPARRMNSTGISRAAQPFTVAASRFTAPGGSTSEESRGAIWSPLWSRQLRLREVRQLFAEARATWLGRPVLREQQMLLSIASLGVDRGIGEFQPFSLVKRNGLAFTAVARDRVRVPRRPSSLVLVLAPVEEWCDRVVRKADTSQAVSAAGRAWEKAVLALGGQPNPDTLRAALMAATRLELAVGRSRLREDVSPRRTPSGQVIRELHSSGELPETAAFRLALALSSAATGPTSSQRHGKRMRELLLPIDPEAADRTRNGGSWRDAAIVRGLDVRPLIDVLGDVLRWRMMTGADDRNAVRTRVAGAGSGRVEYRGVPGFTFGIPAPASDLHAWAQRDPAVDETALAEWFLALLGFDWRLDPFTWKGPAASLIEPTLATLTPLARAMRGTDRGSDAARFALDPQIAALLLANRVSDAHRLAARRWRQLGWETPAPSCFVVPGPRIAAALVPRTIGHYPIFARCARPLRPQQDEDEDAEPSIITNPAEESA